MTQADLDRNEIIEMARHAGIVFDDKALPFYATFAKLVAAKEREACAKVCDDIRHPWGYSAETSDWERGTEHCADAIRARGDKE